MKDFIRVMKALADPNRTRILKLLQKKCLCVCEITDVIKLKQPSVSKHLKIFENAGLVSSPKKRTASMLQNYKWRRQPLCWVV